MFAQECTWIDEEHVGYHFMINGMKSFRNTTHISLIGTKGELGTCIHKFVKTSRYDWNYHPITLLPYNGVAAAHLCKPLWKCMAVLDLQAIANTSVIRKSRSDHEVCRTGFVPVEQEALQEEQTKKLLAQTA